MWSGRIRRVVLGMDESGYSIFISHAAIDQPIAAAIKKAVEESFPSQSVFVSSDPEDLELGDQWIAKVLEALKTAKFVLMLATERGINRKWVWFEAGSAWFTDAVLIPCCVGNLRRADLPPPFCWHMSANLDDHKDFKLVFETLSNKFGPLANLPDYESAASDLTRLEVRVEERQKLHSSPYAAAKVQDIKTGMQRLSPAERETIRQYVVHGELSTSGARKKVLDSGVDMESWKVPSYLVGVTRWIISQSGNSVYDENQQNVYRINPEMRPLLWAFFEQDLDIK